MSANDRSILYKKLPRSNHDISKEEQANSRNTCAQSISYVPSSPPTKTYSGVARCRSTTARANVAPGRCHQTMRAVDVRGLAAARISSPLHALWVDGGAPNPVGLTRQQCATRGTRARSDFAFPPHPCVCCACTRCSSSSPSQASLITGPFSTSPLSRRQVLPVVLGRWKPVFFSCFAVDVSSRRTSGVRGSPRSARLGTRLGHPLAVLTLLPYKIIW